MVDSETDHLFVPGHDNMIPLLYLLLLTRLSCHLCDSNVGLYIVVKETDWSVVYAPLSAGEVACIFNGSLPFSFSIHTLKMMTKSKYLYWFSPELIRCFKQKI